MLIVVGLIIVCAILFHNYIWCDSRHLGLLWLIRLNLCWTSIIFGYIFYVKRFGGWLIRGRIRSDVHRLILWWWKQRIFEMQLAGGIPMMACARIVEFDPFFAIILVWIVAATENLSLTELSFQDEFSWFSATNDWIGLYYWLVFSCVMMPGWSFYSVYRFFILCRLVNSPSGFRRGVPKHDNILVFHKAFILRPFIRIT